LLLAYYDPDGRLVYAGRAGTGIKQAELERLWRRLQPLAISEMPLAVPPPRDSRFESPLVLSRVHWVRPDLVAEVKYLTWTDHRRTRPGNHIRGKPARHSSPPKLQVRRRLSGGASRIRTLGPICKRNRQSRTCPTPLVS
jgi:ATP-dependent DNA ligase